jgi:hypothetical protein
MVLDRDQLLAAENLPDLYLCVLENLVNVGLWTQRKLTLGKQIYTKRVWYITFSNTDLSGFRESMRFCSSSAHKPFVCLGLNILNASADANTQQFEVVYRD